MDKENVPTEPGEELISRVPTRDDVVALCRELNARGVRYIVVGGFAIIEAGYIRATTDLDLLVDTTDLANEQATLDALATLPDGIARELRPGEIAEYTVVRVGDEITVDLMRTACGVTYREAVPHLIIREIDGVAIPFASPRLLWWMKSTTHREKDAPDLLFLREQYADEIFGPDGQPLPLE